MSDHVVGALVSDLVVTIACTYQPTDSRGHDSNGEWTFSNPCHHDLSRIGTAARRVPPPLNRDADDVKKDLF